MTSYRAFTGFYMIKTITGNYIVGLNDKRYNEIHFNAEYGMWINGNTMIPYNAIETYREMIPFKEFIRICKDARILNREDVQEALMDYYDSKGMNPKVCKYIRYMNDLRVWD